MINITDTRIIIAHILHSPYFLSIEIRFQTVSSHTSDLSSIHPIHPAVELYIAGIRE